MDLSKLDVFTRQFIATLLWSTNDDNGEPLDTNYSADDIDADGLAKIIRDCDAFQADYGDAIDNSGVSDPDGGHVRSYAGHDFALTRNGHGAGFWDGDWPDELGEKLTDACKEYGEMFVYVGDDGKLYISTGI